jgi:hypothetical protein
MNTASLEQCKELYKLSGWKETDYFYQFIEYSDLSTGYYLTNPALESPLHATAYPAYDLGYLLRRLPKDFSLQPIIGASWHIEYSSRSHPGNIIKQADTPEDAVCMMAIELFKRGILKRSSE